MKKILLSITVLILLTSCKPTDEQVEKAVAKYIENHPELFEGRAANNEVKPEIKAKIIQAILKDKNLPVIGNENSKNVIVEFYDYNCGYCKKSLDNVMRLANEDGVKIILVELPVLGEESAYAAHSALSVHKIAPEKFLNFHTDLMKHQGRATEEVINSLVKKNNIDAAKFAAEMAKTEEYTKILKQNISYASGLKIGGTPSFLVNGEIVRGAVPYEAFKGALKK